MAALISATMLIPRSGGRHLARVGEVPAVERTHLARKERDDGYRLAGQSHELHLIAFAPFVDVHDRADVTRLEPFVRDVRSQHYTIVLFNHSFASRGYALIKRGATAPLSNCQTVRNRGRRPQGVVSSPATTEL